MSNTNIQFDLSFESDNRFGSSLMRGDFTYIVEIDPPDTDVLLPQATTIIKAQVSELSEINWIFALMMNDRMPSDYNYPSVEFLHTLKESTHKAIIFGLSGKLLNLDDIRANAVAIKSIGCRNIFTSTGNWVTSVPNAQYVDSVDSIRAIATMGNDFNVGSFINPFKYTALDTHLQYARVKRKLANGARYFVCQAGWDMKKPQELQWYLQLCDLPTPIFARIIVIPAENSSVLNEPEIRPDYRCPIPISEILLRAAQESPEAFMTKQIELLALQIVGYQKLGFSGIQIAGCQEVKILRRLYERVQEIVAECPTYDDWLSRWNKEFDGYNLSLVGNPYYMFPNLLQPGYRDPDIVKYPISPTVIGHASFNDRLEAKLNKWAAKDTTAPWLRKTLCKITGTKPENLEELHLTGYLNNGDCPRHLLKGQCSSVYPDGTCDANGQECFFHRVLKLATENKHPELLEED